MFEAVVLAGGEGNDPLALQQGVHNKAFISLQGRPLIGYILTALARSYSLQKIVVVGPKEGLTALQAHGYSFKPVFTGNGSMLDNIARGLREVDPKNLCLLSTGDIPLVSAAIIEAFLTLAAPGTADFYYPIIPVAHCRRRFPHTRRTSVRLKEGTFTGGNVALIRPSWFIANQNRLETFVASRKHPLKLLRILPFSFMIKFIFHCLSLKDLEEYLSRVLHLTARGVPCPHVELATDVDKQSDLETVSRELARLRGKAPGKTFY